MSAKNNGQKDTSRYTSEGLPDHVLQQVFMRLQPTQKIQCALVCSVWKNIVQARSLWNPLEYHFPEKKSENSEIDVEEEEFNHWKNLGVRYEQRERVLCGKPFVQVLKGHKTRVNCCARKGDSLITGSSDKTVRLWKVSKSQTRMIMKAPNPVTSVDLDDVKVVGTSGSELIIWNLLSGKILKRIPSHIQSVKCVKFDDTEAVAGCGDGSVRIFDLYSGSCKQISRPHSRTVTSIGVNWPLHLVTSCSTDGTVKVQDLETSQIVESFENPRQGVAIECLHFSEDGYTLTAGTQSGTLLRWDLRYDKILHQSHLFSNAITSIHSAPYSPQVLAVGGISGVVQVFDSSSFNVKRSLVRPSSFSFRHQLKACPENSFMDYDYSEDLGAIEERLRGPPPQDGWLSSIKPGSTLGPSSAVLDVNVGTTSLIASCADGNILVWKFENAS